MGVFVFVVDVSVSFPSSPRRTSTVTVGVLDVRFRSKKIWGEDRDVVDVFIDKIKSHDPTLKDHESVI